MNGFEGILFATILLAFLAGVFALIYKGSRPPQPVPEHPTPRRKVIVASLIPVVCTAILYATFKGLDLYLRDHLQVEGCQRYSSLRWAWLLHVVWVSTPLIGPLGQRTRC
jgi:hypothetical protein